MSYTQQSFITDQKDQIKSMLPTESKPVQQLLIFHPETWKHQNQKKLLKTVYLSKKAPLQRQDFQPVKPANM